MKNLTTKAAIIIAGLTFSAPAGSQAQETKKCHLQYADDLMHIAHVFGQKAGRSGDLAKQNFYQNHVFGKCFSIKSNPTHENLGVCHVGLTTYNRAYPNPAFTKYVPPKNWSRCKVSI